MNVEQLIAGIQAVRELIDSSSGVYGLHLNGTDAPWANLEAGGRYEGWLLEFNEAEAEIARSKKENK
jgi:hypothetical protein